MSRIQAFALLAALGDAATLMVSLIRHETSMAWVSGIDAALFFVIYFWVWSEQ